MLKKFLENFILVAIALVIVQTLVHELALFLHWSVQTRDVLVITGFTFDVIFSIEWIVRSVLAHAERKTLHYWLHGRGWVDFLSSLPLLLLDSGPSLYLMMSGHLADGSSMMVMNVLKVVKAIRITRILRLLRIIKIFGKIHNVDSAMALHHTASISTTAVFTVICTLIAISLFSINPKAGIVDARRAQFAENIETLYAVQKTSNLSIPELVRLFFARDREVIKVVHRDATVLSPVSERTFADYYTTDDFEIVKRGDIKVFVSMIDINKQIAFEHLENFCVIIALVFSFMVFYTRHFVQTISDVVHILNKGFRKKEYNLQVKIRDEFADHEIYHLARFYNDAYLPAKFKRLGEQEKSRTGGLSMKDLMDFGKR